MFAYSTVNRHLKCAIYRGPGGPGDATADAANASVVAIAAADAAQASAAAASASAAAASASAAAASASAAAAAIDAGSTEAAKIAALAAQAAAELAETNAETAETNAETAQTAAEAAQLAAENAQAAAELARDESVNFADNVTFTATTVSAGGDSTASYDPETLTVTLGLVVGNTGATGATGATGPQGPQGEKGDKGDKGDTGDTGPQGPKGDTGDQGPKGDTGDTGPKGDTGDTGPQGDAATIAVGTVTTVDPTDPATVTNSGTSSAAVFDFEIPKGEKGDKGDTGDTGPQGPQGETGATGATGATGPGVAVGGTTGQILAKNSNTDYDTAWINLPDGLPSQSGNAGKFLTTDGSIASWVTIDTMGKNRIINGDMRIDQRNAGASVTLSAAENRYPVDRWAGFNDTDGTVTAQQVAEAPAGFVNSSKLTVTTADASIGATQRTLFRQRIEGLNVSDLGWGTASAKSVTLSFWVRSSVTGTHGGSIMNSAIDYSHPFTYAISAANTWEFKTVTIAGPTAGTWLTTNGIGLQVIFGLAMGSTYSGTAGAWAATRYEGATGAVQVTNTLNATWYITGVQLEVGSVATPFERRPYGTELALCQRYYYKQFPGAVNKLFGTGGAGSNTTTVSVYVPFPVTMRTAPTALEQSGTANHYSASYVGSSNITCSAVPTHSTLTTEHNASVIFTVASGGVQGGAFQGRTEPTNGASAYLAWSAEL